MTVNQWRRAFYTAARVLGDYQAARRGRLGQRLVNRLMGRVVARAMRRLWR